MKKISFTLFVSLLLIGSNAAFAQKTKNKDDGQRQEKLDALAKNAENFVAALLSVASESGDYDRQQIQQEIKESAEQLKQSITDIDWNAAVQNNAEEVKKQFDSIDWKEVQQSLQKAKEEIQKAADEIQQGK